MTFFTGPWPDGRRGAFALSFDCDVAYAYTANVRPQNPPPSGDDLLAKQPRTLSALSRGYYGLHVGLPRILAFLERRGLRGTFFVPTANVERYPDAFRQVRDSGHEIAAHGHEHENLNDMRGDPETEAAILRTSLRVFDQFLGVRPLGYRSPAWDMNMHTPALLQEAGLLYDSSLFAGEAPYRLSLYDGKSSVLEFPIDWSLDDAGYYLFFKPPVSMAQFHDPDEVLRIWRTELDGVVDDGGLFTLTCHPSVIGRHHRMAILDGLVDHAEARGDVWIAALDQIAAHVTEAWR
ncbi:MAG: polysaccharide deacetylase [Alphaproteobacteria bacterium]|jgi:peptidoglycan/xylan/chitin deacetylase (PgdA/CDA1 family)|nr:polysaccharide deacetylase [Alphaproteobacteria bacterium]